MSEVTVSESEVTETVTQESEPNPTETVEFWKQKAREQAPADDSGLLCGGIAAVPSVEESLAGSDEALLRSLEEELAPYKAGFTLAELRATAAAVGAGDEDDAAAQRGPRVWLEVGRRRRRQRQRLCLVKPCPAACRRRRAPRAADVPLPDPPQMAGC